MSLLLVAPLAAEPTPVSNESFGVTLPAGFTAFTEQKQTTKGENGDIATTTWISKFPTTGEAVVVTMSDMPGKILDPEKMMASTRDSLVASLKATVENEQKIDGDLAFTFKSNGANPAYLQSRLVVAEDRLYQILYVGRSEEQRAAQSVVELFSSFKIVAPPSETVAETAHQH